MSRLTRSFTAGVPIARLLLAGQVALHLGRHVAALDPQERRRLGALIALAAKRRGALSRSERGELAALVAKLEPRLLLGRTVRGLSPVPLPRRLLEGSGARSRRSGSAREP